MHPEVEEEDFGQFLTWMREALNDATTPRSSDNVLSHMKEEPQQSSTSTDSNQSYEPTEFELLPHPAVGRSPKPQRTSIEIFNQHTRIYMDRHGNRVIDCAGVLSRQCYEEWLITRPQPPLFPQERFRKSLISHLTCQDGRSSPFEKPVERELLNLLRQRKLWPCFEGMVDSKGKSIQIGAKGLRCSGFWETGGKRKRGKSFEEEDAISSLILKRSLRPHSSCGF